MGWKATPNWNGPTIPVTPVPNRRFFPLDQKLQLRADHWSEGAARVATHQGLQAKSFALAAQAYTEAVGGSISGDSLQRITEGWGSQVQDRRQAEAERANLPGQREESPRARRVPESRPIAGAANLSTDGAMVLVRAEGWKEVKLVAVSAVTVKTAGERARHTPRPSRRAGDPLVALSDHSYQAGLWEADTMALHQYAEGLRRGLDQAAPLSSVNDGARWIERITDLNFAHATQVVDWSHASQRLWLVANTVLGDQSPAARAWAGTQLDDLWQGEVVAVKQNLVALDLDRAAWPAEVREAPGYFEHNQARMRYADFRAAGVPTPAPTAEQVRVGSGTVESAATTVVHHTCTCRRCKCRLRRPGRGWNRDNAQAMLAGLSELHSGRFAQAWQASLPNAQ